MYVHFVTLLNFPNFKLLTEVLTRNGTVVILKSWIYKYLSLIMENPFFIYAWNIQKKKLGQ